MGIEIGKKNDQSGDHKQTAADHRLQTGFTFRFVLFSQIPPQNQRIYFDLMVIIQV
jgi:hypothetical protein